MATILANLVAKDKPVIYFDEASFQSQRTTKKSWAPRGLINEHVIDKNRFAITVYGAIGNCLS